MIPSFAAIIGIRLSAVAARLAVTLDAVESAVHERARWRVLALDLSEEVLRPVRPLEAASGPSLAAC